jgi:cadmium resistance protein CadD (predicted permease)
MGKGMTAEDKQIEKLRLHRKKVAEAEQVERRIGQIGRALAAILICVLLTGSVMGSPIAIGLSVLIGFLVVGALIVVPVGALLAQIIVVGYHKIRRLGYIPVTATMLALSVVIASVLVLIGTMVLLPETNLWGLLGKILICIGVPIAFMAFCFSVLVRKLPKRNARVFGPRVARSQWFTVACLGSVGTAGLFAMSIYFFVFLDAPLGLMFFFAYCGLFLALLSLYGFAADKLRRNQKTIEEIPKYDPRLPVVFLRPFAQDDRPFALGYSDEISDDGKSGSTRYAAIPFEEYLLVTFWERIGPFVALGNPEDYFRHDGAIRTYANDEGWYEYFERLAGQAACMVMTVSNSDNLQRELTFIRRQGLQRRLFIFTNVFEAPRLHDTIYSSWLFKPIHWILIQLYGPGEGLPRWEQLAENLGKLGFEFGDDPGRGAVVTFDSEGKTKVLVQGALTPSDFVEPIREYLVTTLRTDLGEVAAKTENRQVVEVLTRQPFSDRRRGSAAPNEVIE